MEVHSRQDVPLGPNNENLESVPHHADVTSLPSGKIEGAATGDSDTTDPHRLNTLPTHDDDDHDSNLNHHSHQLNLKETVKDVGHAVKRRIYLHQRHQKDLSKQFSAGSAAQHMGKANHDDVEAQPDQTTPGPNVSQNLWIMVSTFPYWNMAFWSGWSYSIGSALFVIDGLWSWMPLVREDLEFQGQKKYGVPLCFFFGAILYQIGGVMAYLEAVNDGSFAGAAMKRLLHGDQEIEKELLDAKLHTFFGHIVPHHHAHDNDDHHDGRVAERSHSDDSEKSVTRWDSLTKKKSPEEEFGAAADLVASRRGGVDAGQQIPKGSVNEYLTWRWWPTWTALWHYHLFETGYIACTIQLFGVTLYGVTSVVILPGILDNLTWWQTLAAYWIPQVVASCCFLIAGAMFTIMAQDKWNKPKYNAVSWWIGIWAEVGSVGFLLCSIFGIYSHHHTWAEYQSPLSSAWGSFFYMLSGLFQWYEAINVNVGPVLAFPNNRTPVLLRKQKPNR